MQVREDQDLVDLCRANGNLNTEAFRNAIPRTWGRVSISIVRLLGVRLAQPQNVSPLQPHIMSMVRYRQLGRPKLFNDR